MSSSLCWRPICEPPARRLPDALKFKLRYLYGEGNRWRFDAGDVPALRALQACGVEGADKLIALIEKHDEVEVWEQY